MNRRSELAEPEAASTGPGFPDVSGAIRVLRPGTLSYAGGLVLQEHLVDARRRGEACDTLLLLEHDPVVTLGRGADPANVLLDRDRLARRGIALFETGRGGDVTLHSPGQVVGYPIVALRGERRDTHRYLRDLEEVMILAACAFGVEARRVEGLTGIWAGREKLGAIGVRLSTGWITSHGFAFNVANDLSLFDVIVPCGIRGRGVTSLSRLLGHRVDPAEAMDRLEAAFREVFAWLDEAPPRDEAASCWRAEPDPSHGDVTAGVVSSEVHAGSEPNGTRHGADPACGPAWARVEDRAADGRRAPGAGLRAAEASRR